MFIKDQEPFSHLSLQSKGLSVGWLTIVKSMSVVYPGDLLPCFFPWVNKGQIHQIYKIITCVMAVFLKGPYYPRHHSSIVFPSDVSGLLLTPKGMLDPFQKSLPNLSQMKYLLKSNLAQVHRWLTQ